jgi:hypothetical protein
MNMRKESRINLMLLFSLQKKKKTFFDSMMLPYTLSMLDILLLSHFWLPFLAGCARAAAV